MIKNKPPHILFIDIETAPALAYIWELKNDYIPIDMLCETGFILCWGAKWLNNKEIFYSESRIDGKKGCIKKLHKLMGEADIICAHNGNNFDIKTMNAYFIQYGMEPPNISRTIDTLKIARSRFRLISNKLDYLGRYLGVGMKVVHTGFNLWRGCMEGDSKAWATMKAYNIQDVRLLEKVYLKLLPWIKNHPSYAVYLDSDRPVCRNCGSTRVKKKGIEHTNTGAYQRYRCTNCYTPLRGKQNKLARNPNLLT